VKAVRVSDGLVFSGNDEEKFKITQLSIDRKMSPAHSFGIVVEKPQHNDSLVLTDNQKELANRVKVWKFHCNAQGVGNLGFYFS
jgi:hypothetical protein